MRKYALENCVGLDRIEMNSVKCEISEPCARTLMATLANRYTAMAAVRLRAAVSGFRSLLFCTSNCTHLIYTERSNQYKIWKINWKIFIENRLN